MTEQTLAIIKPDAVDRRLAGKIIQRIEDEGFRIRAMRSRAPLDGAGGGLLRGASRASVLRQPRPPFMSSGPAIVLVLEAADAIKKWRT